MKNIYRWISVFVVMGLAFSARPIFAQGMMGYGYSATSTQAPGSPEEIQGQAVWIKLQQKQMTCSDLSNDDYEKLGEYFMGQRLGPNHDAMDNSILRMMGPQGEVQVHILWGQRGSGCATSSAAGSVYGANGPAYFPMMGMMGWPVRGDWYGYGWDSFGPTPGIFMMVFWWAVGIIALVGLIRWAFGRRRDRGTRSSAAIDILNERYAKGEIDKKEFEAKKKDLG